MKLLKHSVHFTATDRTAAKMLGISKPWTPGGRLQPRDKAAEEESTDVKNERIFFWEVQVRS